MPDRNRRLATVVVGGLLAVVVVLGVVVGTRGITDDLTGEVRSALDSASVEDVGFEVSGREVTLDGVSADANQVERALVAIEGVDGVRGVSVTSSLGSGAPTTSPSVGTTPTAPAVGTTPTAPTTRSTPTEPAVRTEPTAGRDSDADADRGSARGARDDADLPDTGRRLVIGGSFD